MSKKIIAVLIVATVVFVSAFASCNKVKKKENQPYNKKDEYMHVTDKDGNKVYDKNGEFVVYVTNEHNRKVTDKSGKEMTTNVRFESFIKDDVIEDYGYKFKIPEGWNTTDVAGKIVNEKSNFIFSLSALNDTYDKQYDLTKKIVDELNKQEGVKATITENFKIRDDFKRCFKVSIDVTNAVHTVYMFEVDNNFYNFVCDGGNAKEMEKQAIEMIKSIQFKPYEYYPERIMESTAKDS